MKMSPANNLKIIFTMSIVDTAPGIWVTLYTFHWSGDVRPRLGAAVVGGIRLESTARPECRDIFI